MEENSVIDLSSDSNASSSPTVDKCDRIAALISKYQNQKTVITRRECISDSDEDTVLISDIDEDKNSVYDPVKQQINKQCIGSTSVDYATPGADLCLSDENKRATTSRNQSSSDSNESISGTTLKKHSSEFYSDAARETVDSIPHSTDIVINAANKKTKRKTADCIIPTAKKTKVSADREAKKLERAAQQQKMREEREQKKQTAMHEKMLKDALKAANKNIKPNECIKYITVHIDPEILNEPYGIEILSHLKSLDAPYKVDSQVVSHTVTWKYKNQTHTMDDNGQLVLSSEIKDTQDILMFMDCENFVNHVDDRSLLSYVENVSAVHGNKRLYLGIYGLESYFKYIKANKKKELNDSKPKQKNSKTDKQFANAPVITKRNIEYALTELQMFCNCCYRTLETPQDVALMIGQFSKAIAQIPYKQEKNFKYQESDWYMAGDKRDTVGVDKNGNGLQRLWIQQLCCFSLTRLETAEAIAAQYPTPFTLMQAYERCTLKEGELLLQDIPIRRAAGPLTSVRKIGPELSKKIFAFFMSTDENVIL